jgi:hypothetical protein
MATGGALLVQEVGAPSPKENFHHKLYGANHLGQSAWEYYVDSSNYLDS